MSLAATRRMRHRPQVAMTSSMARWVEACRPKARDRSCSLCDFKQGSTMRDSSSESIQGPPTLCPPKPFSMKCWSKAELCATMGAPLANSASLPHTSIAQGASATCSLVMPVICTTSGGMGFAGCTNMSNVSTISLPRRRAAATSMSSQSLKSSPVVSVSSTTTSSSSRPNCAMLALCAKVA